MKFNLLKFWQSVFMFGIVEGESTGATGDGTQDGNGASDVAKAETEKKAAADKLALEKVTSGISDKEAELLKEVMARKNAQKETQGKLDALELRFKEYDGLDVEKVRSLLKEKEKAEEEQLTKQGEWERLKGRMAEEHGKSLDKVMAEAKVLEEKLNVKEQHLLELTIGASFSNSKFVLDEMTMTPSKTRVLYGSHFEVEDGKVVGYDKPKGASNRTPLVDAKGDAVSFEDALKKIVEADPDKDSLIRSKIKPGSQSGTQNNGKPLDLKKAEIKGVDRISAGLAKKAGK